MFGHLLPISKTIQIKRTRHAGLFWISINELISDVLQWTPSQFCADTECSVEDLLVPMDDRDERGYIYIYIYIERERERETWKPVQVARLDNDDDDDDENRFNNKNRKHF